MKALATTCGLRLKPPRPLYTRFGGFFDAPPRIVPHPRTKKIDGYILRAVRAGTLRSAPSTPFFIEFRMFPPKKIILACTLALSSAMGSVAHASPPAPFAPSFQLRHTPASEPVAVQPSARTPVTSTTVDLGLWQQRRHAAAAPLSGATQVGTQRTSASTHTAWAVQQQLQWQPSASGGMVAALTFRSADAYALRIGIQVDQLPGSAVLRVYTPEQPDDQFAIAGQRILQILQANRDAGDDSAEAHTWWTPASSGDHVTLEIELPPGTSTADLRIAIPHVLHVYTDMHLPLATDDTPLTASASGTCNVDATCQPQATRAPDGRQLADAVARMSFVKNGGGFVCTGTLLNDQASSGTPYFITANHCISSQTVASTLQTDWFYRTSACQANTLSSASRTLRNGATLLYTVADPDTTLLRLNDAAPAGAVFAGWNAAAPATAQAITGIHHPQGDTLKVSQGALQGYYQCSAFDSEGQTTCYGSTQQSGNYFNTLWSSGTTEPGSSGSGAFHQGLLTGVLSAGSASCSSTGGSSIYASLRSVYPAIQQWLAAESAKPAIARQAVYRFFNHATGAHFYTNNAQERDSIISHLPSYRYEGVGFYAAAQAVGDMAPVHRFFNTKSESHFYTINAQELVSVQANLPSFRYEGTTWYASTSASHNDMRPIYRFYNESTSTHFYTATDAERDYVISNLPSFRFEGTAYYVWTTP